MMKRLSLALVVTTSLLAACNTPSPAPAASPEKTEAKAPAASAPQAKLSTSRALAMAKLRGDAGVDRIVTDLQRSADRNPAKVDFWILLGRAWVRKARESSDPGFYVNANACAEIALEVSPDDKLAYDLQGLVLLNDHKFQGAVDLANKVLAKHPDDAMAYGSLSDALLELGRFDEAADAAQKMMDIKPNLPSYSRASYFRWLAGDEKLALEYARLAIDSGRDPKDPEPRAWELVQAGMIFWHKGDLDGADAGFVKALDGMTEYPPALVGRGKVALARGDAKRAAELFSRAYTQSPLPETAWLLGDARAAAGDAQGAADAFAKLEKDGRRGDPRTLALFFATKDENAHEALALASEEMKARGDVYTEDAYAWALYRTGKVADAQRAIDHARRLGTKDARLVYHQGAIHIAAGDVTTGRKLVATALATNPAFDVDGAREARKLLETKPRS
jgi:tetratricopeptide (TPR) repeat protein